MKAVITLTLSEEMTEEFAKELGEREPEKLACLIKGWWSEYIAQSEFAKEISLDAKVVECEDKYTRFKVGDKVKLSDKAKAEIFPYNLPPVEVGTVTNVNESYVFVDWTALFHGCYTNSDLVLAEDSDD